ncbi:head-tail joining protein [Desulfovibrio gilichinskyi]|uniref:Uncharacterized protein n=1 Tax=Desulfovibrio gilichinskyi TaxID=1519643 RepID=A0A1X7CHL7_9BACT|nr:hypothetical protein [Desulfovibrio gilichinskyi]SME96448.1 hypothetical protein SAMN06295933_0889 [Desulfovibrio gilichinskyi]
MDIHDDLDIFFIGLDAVEVTIFGREEPFKAYKDTDMDEAVLGRAMIFNPDEPVLTCKEVDGTDLERGDSVILEGKTYDVLRFLPDGSGLGKLELSLAQ